MGPTGCPEMSVNNHQSTLRNVPEQRRAYLESIFRVLPIHVVLTTTAHSIFCSYMFRLRVVTVIREPHLTIRSGDYVVKASVSWLELSWLYTLYQLQRLFLVESYDRTIAFGEVEGPGDGWETNGPGLLLLSPVTTDEKPVKAVDVPADIRTRHFPKLYHWSHLAWFLIRSVSGSNFGGQIGHPHGLSWFSLVPST